MRHRVAVSGSFSPGAPIDKKSLFAGRTAQVISVIQAIVQRGQHVVLFGERGVGKTSLAAVLYEFLTDVGPEDVEFVRVNCDAGG